MSAGTQFDGIVTDEETLALLVKKLGGAPLVDEHGRKLYVCVRREIRCAEPKTLIKFRSMVQDIAKQVCLEHTNGFIHAREATGKYVHWLTAKQFRGLFSAIGVQADSIPNPVDTGIVLMLESSKLLTEEQCQNAIAAAFSFGDARGVVWSDPSLQQQETQDERQD